ncbi:MAG: hypothetical protein HOH66_01730 [Rhodospirillaceae bacterium]|nr:hypothetical protein [Rhodospirillaceae bacterium]
MIRYIPRHFLVLLATLLAAAPAAAQSSEAEIGQVIEKAYYGATGHRTSGIVEDLRYRKEVWSDEVVRTGGQAITTLRFLDRTTLYVSNNSEVVLDRFVYDDDSETGTMTIEFAKGAFRFVTGRMSNKDGFELRTPTAAIGIRGTDLKVSVAPNGTTTVSVLAGEVTLSALAGGTGTNLSAGESATANASGVSGPEAGDAVGSGMNMDADAFGGAGGASGGGPGGSGGPGNGGSGGGSHGGGGGGGQ